MKSIHSLNGQIITIPKIMILCEDIKFNSNAIEVERASLKWLSSWLKLTQNQADQYEKISLSTLIGYILPDVNQHDLQIYSDYCAFYFLLEDTYDREEFEKHFEENSIAMLSLNDMLYRAELTLKQKQRFIKFLTLYKDVKLIKN